MRLLKACTDMLLTAMVIAVGFMESGCNQNSCSSGSLITCHFPCTSDTWDQCPDSEPNCDCQDAAGNNITNQFSVPCKTCYCETSPECIPGSSTINIVDDYEFFSSQISGSLDQIYPEYPIYYIDKTQLSLDQNTRPVYFEFNVNGYTESDILTFILTAGSGVGGTEIQQLTFQTSDLSYLSFIRGFNNCTPPSPCDGIVKMEMKSVFTKLLNIAGTYNIEMRKNGTSAVNNDFTVSTQDGSVDWRKLRIDMLSTVNVNASKTLDLTSYTIGSGSNEKTFEESISYVFENGKANIIYFTAATQNLGTTWVDDDADMMFNAGDLANDASSLQELLDAFSKWTERVYQAKVSLIYDNSAFGVEVNALKSYDFSQPTPVVATNNATVISNTYTTSSGHFDGLRGVTIPKDLTGNYTHRGAIVLRKGTVDFHNELSSSVTSSVSEDNLALETFLHEMGHVWSNAAFDNQIGFLTSCQRHRSKGSGLNFDGCLWQTPCTQTSNDLFWLELMNDPKYCESHLQIFMNQLKIK